MSIPYIHNVMSAVQMTNGFAFKVETHSFIWRMHAPVLGTPWKQNSLLLIFYFSVITGLCFICSFAVKKSLPVIHCE